MTVVKHCTILNKLRLPRQCLAVEKGRKINVPITDEMLYFCEEVDITVLEDELHVVCWCPAYLAIRLYYVCFEYANYNTLVNSIWSMDTAAVQSIVAYTYQTLKLSSALVEDQNMLGQYHIPCIKQDTFKLCRFNVGPASQKLYHK